MGFILIPHLDPTHESRFSEILGRGSQMAVIEVEEERRVEPDVVYVIPPGKDMVISHGSLQLLPREAKGPHRPIDGFLRSLGEDKKDLAIGVILSGSGSDGAAGLAAIKAQGGITFAQDDTALHDSMPRSAIAAGCVDSVLAPEQIAQEIARIARHPYAKSGQPERQHEADLAEILQLVREATGADFTNYKRNTLLRRVTRRMVLHRLEGFRDYLKLLQDNRLEVERLFQDILINVTNFFRSPEAFDVLRARVFPRLAHGRPRTESVRMWVLGCSTGEEAYSLAIAWMEFADEHELRFPVQIYATDLNETGIHRARTGVYSKAIVQDVSAERLRRFFDEVDGGYRIRKAIRDLCVFAKHNVLNDPPFSHIDVISCRNMLIYLEPVLQQRIVSMLHYALKPNGFLFLGASETIGSYRHLFEIEDAKAKIYAKKPARVQPDAFLPLVGHPRLAPARIQRQGNLREPKEFAVDPQREVDRILLGRYAPAAVVVNEDLDIVQFRGETGLYLTPAAGKASLNVIKMAREGLLVPLRALLHRAQKEDVPASEKAVQVRSNGGYRQVDLHVLPIRVPSTKERTFLLLFEDSTNGEHGSGAHPEERVEVEGGPTGTQEDKDVANSLLAKELAATREYLQSVIEQQEAVNEELQSANEEVQSANEELQSINEELETSKEEIQSSNEELTTVNEELHDRNDQLNQVNNDLNNLLSSVKHAIVMVSHDLRIRRFTPTAEKLLNLITADVGRPISDIKLNVSVANLEELLTEVIDTVSPKELEVQDRQGRWYLMLLRPYRTAENQIDGAVLMLFDIDALKSTERTLRRQADLLDQAHEPIFTWRRDGTITYWNRGAELAFGYTKEEAIGKVVHALLATSVDPATFLESLDESGTWSGELTQTRKGGYLIVVESRMSLFEEEAGESLVLETSHPITERKQLEEAMRARASELLEADHRKNEFLAMLGHELRNPLSPVVHAVQVLRSTGGGSQPTTQEMLQVVDRQTRRIARLVDDLLDVSRITQGKIRLVTQPVDMRTVVERAVQSLQTAILERGQQLSVTLPSVPPIVQGDQLRLEQVVVNVLENASKYTAQEGHISIELDTRTSGQATLTIADDGAGIAAEMLPKLFDVFFQCDGKGERTNGGLGLGLTLVKRLVELHGGAVEAHSEGLGRGSTFVIRLPRLGDHVEVPAAREPPKRAAQAIALKILVLDDQHDAADSLATLLRALGHDVRVAYDASGTYKLADSFVPDLAFLDLGMKGEDGYQVVQRLSARSGWSNVRFVALTGFGQAEDQKKAREAGFHDYLTKPARLEVLQGILRSTHP
jgi:two-component system CheB/CheR fusion protein